MSKTLTQMATEVLTTADGREKTTLSKRHAAAWFASRSKGAPAIEIGTATPPLQPARPDRPELLSPREVPKRKPGTEAGRIALLHAVAHIELNAVDLHWDIIARFGHVPMPVGFYDDWVKCAEGNHAISKWSAIVWNAWAATMVPFPPMPACGAPPRTPPRI